MGPTGAGKSSFIKRITRDKEIPIGHSLRPGTHQVTPYHIRLRAPETSVYRAQNFEITILDCPGFDDPSSPDQTTITSILQFLNTHYGRDMKLHGIIYMLDICNIRVRGVDRRNIAMFQQLCGVRFYPNVVLCTTHWDLLPNQSDGEDREKGLWTNPSFWGAFAAGGSTLKRVDHRVDVRADGDNQKDVNIVLEIARRHHPLRLRAQEEMKSGRRPSETTAAREEIVWNLYLTQQREQLDARLRQAQASMKEQLTRNEESLRRELEDVEATISREHEEAGLQLARRVEEIEFRRKELTRRINHEEKTADESRDRFPPTPRESEHENHKKKMSGLDEQCELLRSQMERTTISVEEKEQEMEAKQAERQRNCECLRTVATIIMITATNAGRNAPNPGIPQ
ncbi:hypothetical protein LTR13_008483 [Exophiala sideris]|uniref:G domain-containing protein n=1 Tax=Exophiala sideris TaxID=1016849 RepID=A0ABR0J1K7_9EURO|nr:hypothetical protein LTR13_008483 [Exophiala sideris]KAK5053665.1 hypothetical protein LTR69_009310 [Exophiala sideris]